jgi:hypothetical protein
MYDAEGRRTEDEALAVRGEVVELDAAGNVIRTITEGGAGWTVDPISLEGDEGELATRPKRAPDA